MCYKMCATINKANFLHVKYIIHLFSSFQGGNYGKSLERPTMN